MYTEKLISVLNVLIYFAYIFFLVRAVIYYRNEKYKKVIRILIGYILSFILFATIINVDVNRIKEDKKPIFSLTVGICTDGGSTEYAGFGYIIWKYNRLSHKSISNTKVLGAYKGCYLNFLFITLEHHTEFTPYIIFKNRK